MITVKGTTPFYCYKSAVLFALLCPPVFAADFGDLPDAGRHTTALAAEQYLTITNEEAYGD